MILVTFATPPENPFPVSLTLGEPVPYAGMLLLLTGVGEGASERLARALDSRSPVTEVVEYGGAAAVHRAEIGRCYTVTQIVDRAGVCHETVPAVPHLPVAAVLSENRLYRGEEIPWASESPLPLLYTMETIFLCHVCRRRHIPFMSLRRATDTGQGDIRRCYEEVLAAHRAETATLLSHLLSPC